MAHGPIDDRSEAFLFPESHKLGTPAGKVWNRNLGAWVDDQATVDARNAALWAPRP